MNSIQPTRIQRLIRVASVIGTLHFALGMFLWVAVLGVSLGSWGASQIDWSILRQALPGAGLLIGFSIAFRLSRTHLLAAAVALLISTVASVASFRYDMAHDRYQMQVFSGSDGCSHSYITWFWWPYDR